MVRVTKSAPLWWATLLGLLLAACSNPEEAPQVRAPELSSAETIATTDRAVKGAYSAVTSFINSETVALANWHPDFGGVLSIAAVTDVEPDWALERGTWEWDGSDWQGGEHEEDFLSETWPYFVGDVEKEAELRVDYVSTVFYEYPDAYVEELPGETTVSLKADDRDFGQVSASIEYLEPDECVSGPIPSHVAVDGYVGPSGDRLTVSGVFDSSVTADAVSYSTAGNANLVSGGDRAALDWDVAVDFRRERSEDEFDCRYSQLPTSISVEAGLSAYDVDVDLQGEASFDYDEDSDDLTGIALEANLSLNGNAAVGVTGAFSAEDTEFGENVTFTFSNGETLTFAEVAAEVQRRYSSIYLAAQAVSPLF